MSTSKPAAAKEEGHGSSQGGSSGSASRRNLVFLNMSNPGRDSKMMKHRKLVSKHAMLGRARPDQSEGIPQESTTAGSSKSGSPPHHRFVNTSQEEAEASRKAETQRREIAHASRNLPILAPSPVKSSTVAMEKDVEGEDAKDSRQQKLSGPGKLVSRLPAKKNHLSMHRPWRAIVRKNAMPSIISPSDPLGAGTFDPFATLATGSNPRINRLVHAYVNAHVITNRWYQGIPGYGQTLINARRNLWFPLTLESKAAAKALRMVL